MKHRWPHRFDGIGRCMSCGTHYDDLPAAERNDYGLPSTGVAETSFDRIDKGDAVVVEFNDGHQPLFGYVGFVADLGGGRYDASVEDVNYGRTAFHSSQVTRIFRLGNRKGATR